ncbi:MAG: ComF family protein, partial [Bacteroidia bacterium]|nr:ComF family protein [Bacteroidia bacterium]
ICINCECDLLDEERNICLSCLVKLPLTGFHKQEDNPVIRKFKGRSDLCFADAYTYYHRSGIMQKLIHQLKYRANHRIGIDLGERYGRVLSSVPDLKDVSHVIPVPIHKKKEKQRKYNQAAMIAKGISKQLKVSMLDRYLQKTTRSGSQTKKDVFERWQNTRSVFQINRKFQALETRHILLVDDVITTGATLCACVDVIKEMKDCKVSVAAIAFTAK